MRQINSIEEINDLKNKYDMLLLYFSGGMCSVCQSLMPKIETMIESYPDIITAQVDIQKYSALAAGFQVFTVPVVILFVKGQETIREAGVFSLMNLEEKIARYVAFLQD
ncbi:thioredoxin family protein [Eubacteriaceae bacterium ES2]|nr:thioredoxin family protein [Eubacteriaceae bacterium ES2]